LLERRQSQEQEKHSECSPTLSNGDDGHADDDETGSGDESDKENVPRISCGHMATSDAEPDSLPVSPSSSKTDDDQLTQVVGAQQHANDHDEQHDEQVGESDDDENEEEVEEEEEEVEREETALMMNDGEPLTVVDRADEPSEETPDDVK
jgi:hypothetical protein